MGVEGPRPARVGMKAIDITFQKRRASALADRFGEREKVDRERLRLKTNPVLISAVMSAVTDQDRWENRWLAKERAANKIDAAVALVMALGVAMAPQTPAFDPMAMIG